MLGSIGKQTGESVESVLKKKTKATVVISAHLPRTEHSLFHAHVPLSATEVLLSQDRACGTVYRLRYKTDHQLRTV